MLLLLLLAKKEESFASVGTDKFFLKIKKREILWFHMIKLGFLFGKNNIRSCSSSMDEGSQ